ncbi:MAG TPA: glycosyltransferase [Solirubrobacteraceae bacterium]
MRVAFDSRPGASGCDVGRYSRCLLQALRDIAGEHDEILETHRPRRAQVFHAPWLEGAMLHSPCAMVVTIHDLDALTRRSERLRSGGVHLRLRHLALQRASHVIVPSEALAGEAVAELGFERERVIVIPPPRDPVANGAGWLDSARADGPVANGAGRPDAARAGDPITNGAGQPDSARAADPVADGKRPNAAPASWTWRDAGRETWRVYERALARPERPCVGRLSRRLAVRSPRGSSSAEL